MCELKPFIKLLRTPKGFYFYEVNRNEIVQVEKDTFILLNKILAGQSLDGVEQTTVDKLNNIKNKGYLSTKRIKKIKHPMTDDLKYILNNKMQKMTLQLTQNCNFRCSYCIYSGNNNDKQRQHTNVVMSFDTAKKAIDFLCEHSRDSNFLNISFYGGEPLLEFELMKKATEYAKKKLFGKHLTFNMTTNGSLFTNEIVEFCIDNEINVLVSLDGPKEIHDKHRKFANGKGTFDVITSNISDIKNEYPQFFERLNFNMVVDPNNDPDCINTITIDYGMFEKDKMMLNLIDDNYFEEKNNVSDSFIIKTQYDAFIAYLSYFGRVDERFVTTLSKEAAIDVLKDIEKMGGTDCMPDEAAPGGPCIPGALRCLADVHGNLFPCERCSETSKAMCIGSLEHGFDIQKAKNILNIGAITEEQCKNCWSVIHCTICASQVEDNDTFSEQMKLSKCMDVRNRTEAKLRDIIMLSEIKNYYMENNKSEVKHA